MVIVWISGLMPSRSVVGTTNLRAWMQFYHYLKMSGKIEGGASIEDQFNRFLPYALVFGVEHEWAARFRENTYAKPEWYESDSPVITLDAFVNELFPLVNYVGTSLDRSHDPTVE